MKKKVSSVPILPQLEQEVELPVGSKILGITATPSHVFMNILHSPDQPVKKKHTIISLAVNEEYDGDLRFIGSMLMAGRLSFHVFEKI